MKKTKQTSKKSTKKPNKYFVYLYAYDADEVLPPFHGRVDNETYDNIPDAKQAMMRTNLNRFMDFELILLEVKDSKSDIEDREDCYEYLLINNLPEESKKKLEEAYKKAKEQTAELNQKKKHYKVDQHGSWPTKEQFTKN